METLPGRRVGVTATIDRGDPWPGRERTAAGQAQLSAALEAENRLEPRHAVMRLNVSRMRAEGPKLASMYVIRSMGNLRKVLGKDPLRLVEDAAAGHVGAGNRARAIVERQEALIRNSGSVAVMAARECVEKIRPFNTLQAEWAGALPMARWEGVAGLASHVTHGRLYRPRGSEYRSVGLSMNPKSPHHMERPITLEADPGAVMFEPYAVMYTLFDVRVHGDPEEIDSPKPARLADECEVRVPDGTLVDVGRLRITAHASRLGVTEAEAVRRHGSKVGGVRWL